MVTVYLAGPLFTLAERRFNEELAGQLTKLSSSLQVILPQQYDAEFAGAPDYCQKIYKRLIEAIDLCDVVVAVLDGPDTDSGTCIEMGYAFGRGKRVIGVRTDFRGSEDQGVNLMVSNVCSEVLTEPSTTTTLERLASRIVAAVIGRATTEPK